MAGTPNEDDAPSAPETIYHYCGVESFFGIIRDKELWLSNCRFMNDYAEHVGMIKRVDDYLEGLSLGEPQDGFREALRSLMAVPMSPHVACFSSAGDVLSQWRAYADDGAGFAIGFSGAAIAGRCDDVQEKTRIMMSLLEVQYEPNGLFNSLCETIEKCLTDPEVANWEKNDLVPDAGRAVWLMAAVCKNGGFREEREWRIVTTPKVRLDETRTPTVKGGVSERRFRVKAGWIVPYFVLRFPGTAITEVRLGPKNYAREPETEMRQTLREFLETNGCSRGIRIKPSEATYR